MSFPLAEIAVEANLAPSVHNTQPCLWQAEGAQAITLSLDPARRLSVGDPEGQDARLSGGAAMLGTQIALARRGIGLRGIELDRDAVRLVLGGTPTPPAPLDLLRARTTFRAGFAAASAAQKSALRDALLDRSDAVLWTDPAQIAELAALNDAASLGVMRDDDFRAELRSWMRLSRRHKDWDRDGLSAEALAMSGPEAFGAGIVLRPWLFGLLDRVGLSKPITAEAAKTRSATGLLAFHRPAEESRWDSGAAFYSLWLALTQAGFAAWPMAVLADDPAARAHVSQLAGLGDDRVLITVLRLGPHPGAAQPHKARRAGAELIKAA